MIRFYILVIILFISHSLAQAQKHDYIWTCGFESFSGNPNGGGMNINFNTIPPAVQNIDRPLNFSLYCGACSDSNGVLLFYTNGAEIHNYTNQLMQNGDTLNVGPYWFTTEEYGSADFTGAFALPDPGHSNFYYLIHTSIDIDVFADSVDVVSTPLFYTYIDMNANNGKGKVVKKNQFLLGGKLTHASACKHGNGRDWWIIICDRGEPVYHTYLISPDGIEGPFTQAIGPPIGVEYLGKSIFTPDGQTYVRHNSTGGLYIFDFDRCTGQLSNPRLVGYPSGFYTWYAAASPDSRFLYLNHPNALYSLDLKADDLGASFDTVAVYDGFACPNPWQTGIGLPGLGPDGKIYYATHNGTKCMHELHHPNLPGWAADFEQHGLALPRYSQATMCPFPNYRLGVWEGSPCDTVQPQSPPAGFRATTYEKHGDKEQGSQDTCKVYHIDVGKAPAEYWPAPANYYIKQVLQRQKTNATKNLDKE